MQGFPFKAGAPLPGLLRTFPPAQDPGSGHSGRNRYEEKEGKTIDLQSPRQLSKVANVESVEEWLEIRYKSRLRKPALF